MIKANRNDPPKYHVIHLEPRANGAQIVRTKSIHRQRFMPRDIYWKNPIPIHW